MNDLWQPIPFDPALITKYDRPGPRYTSYPTAPQFTDGFGPAEHASLLANAADSAGSGRPLSLYVHVPFCDVRCFFCGCNVTISHDRTWGRRYLPMLDREMEIAASLLGAHAEDAREVVQMHWGGGTPTFLPAEDLTELMTILRRRFRFSAEAEIGVEIDPRECTPGQLDALVAGGANRLSLGVQDLDPVVQAAINRIQPVEETWQVIEGARRRGIRSLNIDLIYGLPHQIPKGFAETVREVLRMAPDRLALFNFAYLPSMFKHQRVIDPAAMPSPAAKLEMLGDAVAALTDAGYVFIGMDHFARAEDPLARALRERTMTRNFQGYSTFAGTDLVAFGVSSISEVAGGYAQNVKTIGDYQAALVAGKLPTHRGLFTTAEDRLRRDVILRLMCHFRVDKREVESRHCIDFDRYFASEIEALRPMAADGLVELEPGRIEVTPLGRLVVRNVAMTFDAYLAPATAASYSRTV